MSKSTFVVAVSNNVGTWYVDIYAEDVDAAMAIAKDHYPDYRTYTFIREWK